MPVFLRACCLLSVAWLLMLLLLLLLLNCWMLLAVACVRLGTPVGNAGAGGGGGRGGDGGMRSPASALIVVFLPIALSCRSGSVMPARCR